MRAAKACPVRLSFNPQLRVEFHAARRKLFDGRPLSADTRAHGGTRAAPDVIERTAQTGSRLDVGGSVSLVGSNRRQTFGGCGINRAGATSRAPVVPCEWAAWVGRASWRDSPV